MQWAEGAQATSRTPALVPGGMHMDQHSGKGMSTGFWGGGGSVSIPASLSSLQPTAEPLPSNRCLLG